MRSSCCHYSRGTSPSERKPRELLAPLHGNERDHRGAHPHRARAGFLEAAKLSEDWIGRMGERALVLEAHHTTHIEGTQLTLEQSERLLAGRSTRGGSGRRTRAPELPSRVRARRRAP